MKLKLTKNELLLLVRLCSGSGRAGELATATGLAASNASTALRRLKDKGFVELKREGTAKTARLSPAAHARALKELYGSRPRAQIESWLSGHAIEVLVLLAEGGATLALLRAECSCANSTLHSVLNRLYAAGVASRGDERNSLVRITDKAAEAFAKALEVSLSEEVMSRVTKGAAFPVRMRKHTILRAEAPQDSPVLAKTGLTRLLGEGLAAIPVSQEYYYFNLDEEKRKICVEEAFVHALLFDSREQRQNTPILTVFLNKNAARLDFPKLRRLARDYGVGQEFKSLEEVLSHYSQMEGCK